MPKPKFALHFLLAVFLTLGLSISFQSLLAQWQAPTASPPNDNAPAPVNVSSNDQYKQAPLGVNLNRLPDEDFEIGGAVSHGESPTPGAVRLRITDTTNNPELQLRYGSGHWAMYAAGASELRFWRGNNRMILDSTGNLGATAFCPDGIGNCDPENNEAFTGSGIGVSSIYDGSGGEIDIESQIDFNGNNVRNIRMTTALDMNNNNINNFFSGGCGNNSHITGINSDGSISCGDDSGDISSVWSGDGLSGGSNSGGVTLEHDDTSSQASIGDCGICPLMAIDEVELDGFGHVTSLGQINLQTKFISEINTYGAVSGGGDSNTVDIYHTDTSEQVSVNGWDGEAINHVDIDDYGHVTSLAKRDFDARFVEKSGDSMHGSLSMGNNRIRNLGTPVYNSDAATKSYVDSLDVSLSGCSWSSYQNSYDETFSFSCSSGQVLTGVGSRHDDSYEDRQFRFRCCDIDID